MDEVSLQTNVAYVAKWGRLCAAWIRERLMDERVLMTRYSELFGVCLKSQYEVALSASLKMENGGRDLASTHVAVAAGVESSECHETFELYM